MKSYLEFEGDIKVLEEELDKLKDPFNKDGLTEVDTHKISQIQEVFYFLKQAHVRIYLNHSKNFLWKHQCLAKAHY